MQQIDQEQRRASELIRRIVDTTGLSATEIAKRAGIAPSTLTRIYPTPSVKYTLSARTLGKLAAAFPAAGAPSESIAYASGSGRLRDVHARGTPDSASIPIYRLAPRFAETGPVMKASALELFDGDLATPVGAWHNAGLDPDRYFILYMPDDSMEPRIRAGEALLIDRVKPPALHSEVLVALGRAGGDALSYCIAELDDRNRETIVLRQTHYDVSATLHRSEILALFHIGGRFDGAILQ